MLGDKAYSAACGNGSSICPETLVRANGEKIFTYGELVAFSGDFYGTWDDIYQAKTDAYPFPASLLKSWDKVKQLKNLVSKEETAIDQMKLDPSVEYPDFNIKFMAAFGTKYLELQTNNISHFGWHNLKAYVMNHEKAIELAIQAKFATDPAKKRELLTQAMFANGFADHFLTDSFASGHVRMPRAQSLAWGAKQSPGYSEQTMGVLAKVIHDNDPCVYKAGIENICRGEGISFMNHGILQVSNSRGDNWGARSDGDLYRESEESEIHIRLPIEAVAASIKEVLQSFETGQAPDGVYEATHYAPFVSANEADLASGFQRDFSDQEIENILASAGLLGSSKGRMATGLNDAARTRLYFQSLPTIMKNFREDVKNDIASDPKLKLRLPEAYLNGYLNVR